MHIIRRITVFLAITVTVALSLSTAQAKKPSKKQQQLQLKVNTYVGLLNTWSPYMRKSETMYRSWVDAKNGPTCEEKRIKGPSSLGDTAEKKFADIASILKKGPALEADAAAAAMVGALQEIREPSTVLSNYYFKREYQKDGCTLGKELHPKLMSAWATYFKNEPAVRAFVVDYNNKLAIEELTKTKKKYGEKIRYHFQKMRMDGKNLIGVAGRELSSSKPNMAAIQAVLDTFRVTQEASVALYQAERTKGKKSKIAAVLKSGGFAHYGDFHGANLVRAVEDGMKAHGDAAQSSRMRERAIKAVFDRYNKMVSAGNKVAFSKQVK